MPTKKYIGQLNTKTHFPSGKEVLYTLREKPYTTWELVKHFHIEPYMHYLIKILDRLVFQELIEFDDKRKHYKYRTYSITERGEHLDPY